MLLMKFTTLRSLSDHLSAVMLPLFAHASSPSQALLDNSWLIWQLEWLFPNTPLIPDDLRNTITHLVTKELPSFSLPDEVRRRWMLHIGFPTEKRTLRREWKCPQQLLKKILDDYFACVPNDALNEEDKVISYVKTWAGLPESKTPNLRDWLLGSNPEGDQSHAAYIEKEPVFFWLDRTEIENTLAVAAVGQHILASGALRCIPLPRELPRPASFMLPDKSLWLLWPESTEQTSLHPVLQKALLCHEAAHLQRNLRLADNAPSAQADSMWESEKDALLQEWFSLLGFFQSETIEDRQRLWQKWVYDNSSLQKTRFREDWRLFRQKGALIFPTPLGSAWISLPFLSSVYSCLSEDLFTTNTSADPN